MVKVRLAGQAQSYIRTEAAYLRKRSEPAANAFLSRLWEARKTLAQFPEAGFVKEDLPVAGTRRYVVGSYLLDYDLVGGDVLITAIRPAQKPDYAVSVDDDVSYEDDGPPPPGIKR